MRVSFYTSLHHVFFILIWHSLCANVIRLDVYNSGCGADGVTIRQNKLACFLLRKAFSCSNMNLLNTMSHFRCAAQFLAFQVPSYIFESVSPLFQHAVANHAQLSITFCLFSRLISRLISSRLFRMLLKETKVLMTLTTLCSHPELFASPNNAFFFFYFFMFRRAVHTE